jgi:hypothetical protein
MTGFVKRSCVGSRRKPEVSSRETGPSRAVGSRHIHFSGDRQARESLVLEGAASSVDGTKRTSSHVRLESVMRTILLQKSKVASVRIFGETLKRKQSTIRITSVALPKSPMSFA